MTQKRIILDLTFDEVEIDNGMTHYVLTSVQRRYSDFTETDALAVSEDLAESDYFYESGTHAIIQAITGGTHKVLK